MEDVEDFELVLFVDTQEVRAVECDPDTGWPNPQGYHVNPYDGTHESGQDYNWIAVPD